jgi:hypothetical protein
MMPCKVLGIAVLLASLAVPRCVLAAGALAAGVPDNVAQDGVAMYVHVNAATTAEARAKALKGCRNLPHSSPKSKSLCKIVATFSNQCAGESIDPQDGTPGWGWAVGDTREQARSQAIANCRAIAGPTRQDACIIEDRSLWCDGTAR